MSLINTTIKPFKATAYWNGKEINLTEACWASGLCSSSTPLTSHSCAPLNWATWLTSTKN